MRAELAPHCVMGQFKGAGQSMQPLISYEGSILLIMRLSGVRAADNRVRMATLLAAVAAGDERVVELVHTNASRTDTISAMARENVAAMGGTAADGDVVVADAALARKKVELDLKEREHSIALAGIEVLKQVTDAELTSQQRKDAYALEALQKRSDVERTELQKLKDVERTELQKTHDVEDNTLKRRRGEELSHADAVNAKSARAAAIAARDAARHKLINLAATYAELRASVRADDPVLREQIIEQHIDQYRTIAGWSAPPAVSSQVPPPSQPSQGPEPQPLGPRAFSAVHDHFTVRDFAKSNKLLKGVEVVEHDDILLQAGRQLADVCRTKGWTLITKVKEGLYDVHKYPAIAAPSARDIFFKLTKGKGLVDIRLGWAQRRASQPSQGADAPPPPSTQDTTATDANTGDGGFGG